MEYNFKSLYSEIGGQETIDKLVAAFYPRVYADPELRPLFEGDIGLLSRKWTIKFETIETKIPTALRLVRY
jgi:hemoglobin